MADLVTCGACGAPVPVGRIGCGRCGSRLVGTEAALPAEVRSAKSTRLVIIGASLVVGSIAIAMLAGSRDASGPVAASGVNSAAATGMTPGASAAANSPEREPGVPAPEFAALDASRSGIASYNSGDVASSVTQFSAAVEADPNNAAALNNLGQVLVRTGRAREAIPHFDRAIELSENVWSYHFNRARAYAELKQWRQAIVGYTEAARLFPDDYATEFNLAKARQADGDLAGAIEGYARAAELAPGQADFRLWQGRALDLAGRAGEATAAYQRFLELEPEGPQAEKVKARLAQIGGGAGGVPPAAP